MRVVILAPSAAEGAAYARAGGHPRKDVVIASSSPHANPHLLHGLVLHDEDLVVEFPGFREGPKASQIVDLLQRSIRRSGTAGPEWRQIDGALTT